MKKRAALARALALEPEVLFLDEPTSGLDPITARAFDALLDFLNRDLGLTVLMVTHDLDTLLSIARRIVVLGRGKVLADGTRRRGHGRRRRVDKILLLVTPHCATRHRLRHRRWNLTPATPSSARWCWRWWLRP